MYITSNKTHSFSVNNIDDGADLALVLSVVDKHNTANFDKTSKSLNINTKMNAVSY